MTKSSQIYRKPYLFLTLKSCILAGVNKAFMEVTIGPSVPATIIVWPSRNFPLTRTMSMVVPKPKTRSYKMLECRK